MEFMGNGSIDRCIGSLSAKQKVLAILRATLAVDFVHSQGEIHGDIKPSNLRRWRTVAHRWLWPNRRAAQRSPPFWLCDCLTFRCDLLSRAEM
jgi:hypothetical protein